MVSYFGWKPPSLGGVAEEAEAPWQLGGPFPPVLASPGIGKAGIL